MATIKLPTPSGIFLLEELPDVRDSVPSTRMCSWRCLVAYIGKLSANLADREDESMRVSGEMLEMERVG